LKGKQEVGRISRVGNEWIMGDNRRRHEKMLRVVGVVNFEFG